MSKIHCLATSRYNRDPYRNALPWIFDTHAQKCFASTKNFRVEKKWKFIFFKIIIVNVPEHWQHPEWWFEVENSKNHLKTHFLSNFQLLRAHYNPQPAPHQCRISEKIASETLWVIRTDCEDKWSGKLDSVMTYDDFGFGKSVEGSRNSLRCERGLFACGDAAADIATHRAMCRFSLRDYHKLERQGGFRWDFPKFTAKCSEHA